MVAQRIATRDEWLRERQALLAEEKAFTKARDALAARRRAMPKVKVEPDYVFASPAGPTTLAGLFAGKSQLIVYHFMFAPDWEQGCKSCSFWMDSFNGVTSHLAQRDVAFACVSIAPLAKLEAFKARMGWDFAWVSSAGTNFNADFGVSPGANGKVAYNYGKAVKGGELPGLSVFARARGGAVFHTYSCYARGLDPLNAAYQLLDLTPKGRDEAALPFSMAWVKHHDRYDG